MTPLRRLLLVTLMLGCASPARVFLRVRDPAQVTLMAETPEGRVVVLPPSMSPDKRVFRSVNLPYFPGDSPGPLEASAERLADGSIMVMGDPVLSRDGILTTRDAPRRPTEYPVPPQDGAVQHLPPDMTSERVAVSFCIWPWNRRCGALTLVTPRENVVLVRTR